MSHKPDDLWSGFVQIHDLQAAAGTAEFNCMKTAFLHGLIAMDAYIEELNETHRGGGQARLLIFRMQVEAALAALAATKDKNRAHEN